MRRVHVLLALLLALGLAVTGSLLAAQEHPTGQAEHPQAQKHPAAKPVSTAELEKAIRARVGEKAKAEGGQFHVKDEVLNKTWNLTLVRVHTDKLTQLDPQTYFACVDFKADDGTMVDVDFFLKPEDSKLAITDTSVHKINGKPRYQYVKKGNFWERAKAS